MNFEDVSTFVGILRAHQVEYVVAGGSAIELEIPSVSRDVDALVLPKEYARVAQALGRDPRVVSISDEPGIMASGRFLSRGALVRYDLLDPSAYSGTSSGPEFFQYVRRYHVTSGPYGPVARPWVVWYMRLVIDDWRTYVEKVLRDLRAGAPWAWHERVLGVARHLGTEAVVRDRLREVVEARRLLGLDDRSSDPGRGTPKG